ncbi:ionotropic receptor 25a [Planococcus citri]|uniref:ionotropic receptor 25a n=1 Tax=Planococcus citri TaxID=170843 RepID=UPI0031FA10F9
MNFEYELVLSQDADTMGLKTINEGILRDVFTEKIDIAVAPLSMTAAKAEIVDFVTPYFENSGLSIVIRRPIRKSSFFKFMTVLNMEVWLSIVNTIFITALAIWLIQKYSPTCKRLSLYEENRREFTFRESIWFAITTFTNQGTGEMPFSPPHKFLIAAYWIFVLVMMATFTANLAAFLTVERLQAPISSFWELTHNTRIKFTVVKNSHAHSYFKNMKIAEEILFSVWKDLALKQSKENETQYRIWDYPIKEEYSHVLRAIELNNPVPSASVGFQKVLDSEKGEFALIHDASEIRYNVYNDCRLIEVGDIFGERPFSIVIKKQSHLKNEIKNRILDLHEERYFEWLSTKYWNTSKLSACSSNDGDTEAITLDSLGGVFVILFCGILLSLISLTIEIIRFKFWMKKHKKRKSSRFLFFTNHPN